jgi:hypothetical protein
VMVADDEGSATAAAVAVMSETRLLCPPDETEPQVLTCQEGYIDKAYNYNCHYAVRVNVNVTERRWNNTIRNDARNAYVLMILRK